MKALILANTTIDPIRSFFKRVSVTVSGYNDLLTALTKPDSPAYSGDFDAVFCYVDGDQLFGDAIYGLSDPIASDDYLRALTTFSQRNPTRIVVTTTACLTPLRYNTFADPNSPVSLTKAERTFNEQLRELASRLPNLVPLDIEGIFRQHGAATLLTDGYWYLGRVRYTNLMFRNLAEKTEQVLDAYLDRARKVLVVDLDNTLWGGVLGEDGVAGIVLSEEGVGKCYRDLQKAVKALTGVGVLLAINSKNNQADVDQVFRDNRMMVLQREDFASIRVNWDTKVANMKEIASELGLGLDSFVLLDDSRVERESIAAVLPEVAVPQFPGEPERFRSWFLADVVYPYFPKYKLTSEDREKTQQYKARLSRERFAAALTHEQFLASLEIRLTYRTDDPTDAERASQLTQKTNQFNVTTRRYSVADIRAFMANEARSVVVLDYSDRFGPEGTVGLAIVDFSTAELDSFLLSCRVIGRGVETEFLKELEGRFARRGLHEIRARFIPTRRNSPAADVFESHGFTLVSTGPDGTKEFIKKISCG